MFQRKYLTKRRAEMGDICAKEALVTPCTLFIRFVFFTFMVHIIHAIYTRVNKYTEKISYFCTYSMTIFNIARPYQENISLTMSFKLLCFG